MSWKCGSICIGYIKLSSKGKTRLEQYRTCTEHKSRLYKLNLLVNCHGDRLCFVETKGLLLLLCMYVPASSIVTLPCRRRRQEEDQERIQESFWMAKQQQWRYVLSSEKFTWQKRQYPIAYLYPSTYVAKIHQDNNFLAFLMISITVHHMDKSVLFCLHMWFSQCLLGMEEGRGYAWKTQYHHHHAVVWDIRRSKSKRGEGEKMEKWKRSHFFARQ